MMPERFRSPEELVDFIAQQVWRMNVTLGEVLGDPPYPWQDLPEEERQTVRATVWKVLRGGADELRRRTAEFAREEIQKSKESSSKEADREQTDALHAKDIVDLMILTTRAILREYAPDPRGKGRPISDLFVMMKVDETKNLGGG